MLTSATLIANRRNARRSTGPRAVEERAVASGNAIKHDLRSRRLLLPGESAADYDQFGAALRADLAPDGALEQALVERIGHILWRLRRVPWVEAGLLRAHTFENRRQRLMQYLLSPAPPVPPSARPLLDAEGRRAQESRNDVGRAFERTVLRSDSLTKLARYEATLDRAVHRALTQLAALQRRRPCSATDGGATGTTTVPAPGGSRGLLEPPPASG